MGIDLLGHRCVALHGPLCTVPIGTPPAPGKKPMRENSAFLRTGVFAFLTTDAVPSSVRSWRNDKSGEMIRTLRKRFRCGTGREPPGPRVDPPERRAPGGAGGGAVGARRANAERFG